VFGRLFGKKKEEKTQDDLLLEQSLQKTRSGILGRIGAIFQENEITDELWEELEDTLVAGDVGMTTSEELLTAVRERVQRENIKAGNDAYLVLKQEMVKLLKTDEPLPHRRAAHPHRGAGGGRQRFGGRPPASARWPPTTSAAGARCSWARRTPSALRAIDQLKIWGERAGVEVIAHEPGADPGAGHLRCHPRQPGEPPGRPADRGHRGASPDQVQPDEGVGKGQDGGGQAGAPARPHEVLLVLDASTGQNAIVQAKAFQESAGVTGIVLTKLDGTSKGGAVLSIKRELGVPVRFVGTGEKVGDFALFDPVAFVTGLVGGVARVARGEGRDALCNAQTIETGEQVFLTQRRRVAEARRE
jgi:fused signal recognition particle receptor